MKIAPAVACLLLLSSSCGPPPGTRFEGRAESPVATPEAIVEQAGQPSGVERLGQLQAACTPVRASPPLRGVRLSDLDCSEARLRLSLRDTAAARGGDTLLNVACHRKDVVECRAELGRSITARGRFIPNSSGERPAVVPNVRGELGHEVEVDYLPLLAKVPLQPRSEGNVRELSVLPLSHTRVGILETRCGACDELGSRDALRIAAGRMGISDVVAVRCVPLSSGFRCVGEGAVPQVRESPL